MDQKSFEITRRAACARASSASVASGSQRPAESKEADDEPAETEEDAHAPSASAPGAVDDDNAGAIDDEDLGRTGPVSGAADADAAGQQRPVRQPRASVGGIACLSGTSHRIHAHGRKNGCPAHKEHE